MVHHTTTFAGCGVPTGVKVRESAGISAGCMGDGALDLIVARASSHIDIEWKSMDWGSTWHTGKMVRACK